MNYEDVIKQDVNLRKLTSSASFAEEDIIMAAMTQPALYLDAVRLRVAANRDRQREEMKFDLLKSELSREIRKTYTVKTEGHLKEILIRKKSYRRAKRKFDEAVIREGFFEKLMKMMDMRMQSIRVVSGLMSAERNIGSRDRNNERERDDVRRSASEKYKKRRH